MTNDDLPTLLFTTNQSYYISYLSSCWVLVDIRPNGWCTFLDTDAQQNHHRMQGS